MIHVLPQEYIIDDQDGIKEPLGMAGVRLEAKVHIVTGAVSSAQNIIKCANRCGLQVADIVLQPLASAEAVLDDDEKELGVALVDIGGGTTDIAIFSDGAIVHTAVIALGGNSSPPTSPSACARRTRGRAHQAAATAARGSMVDEDETIEVPSRRRPPAARQVRGRSSATIIEPRVEEIFKLVHREIQKCGYEDLLGSGVRHHRRLDACSTACPSWPKRSWACRCAAACRWASAGSSTW